MCESITESAIKITESGDNIDNVLGNMLIRIVGIFVVIKKEQISYQGALLVDNSNKTV